MHHIEIRTGGVPVSKCTNCIQVRGSTYLGESMLLNWGETIFGQEPRRRLVGQAQKYGSIKVILHLRIGRIRSAFLTHINNDS